MAKKLENMEGVYFVNSEGEVAVIRKYINSKEVYIEFKNELYPGTAKTTLSNLRKGSFKNKNKPTIHNYGIVGDVIENPKSHILYDRWSKMISRCYNENNRFYPNYGGVGVKVSDRWRYFFNYVEDISNMENYDSLIENPSEWHIDKDILGKNLYSKETCLIVKAEKNISIASQVNKERVIVQYNLDGSFIKEYKSIITASNELGILRTSISECLNGRTKTSGGFIWKYK